MPDPTEAGEDPAAPATGAAAESAEAGEATAGPEATGAAGPADAAALIRAGDVAGLRALLRADPGLATARPDGARTLLHVATDWPGRFPNGPAVVAALVEAGADVDAPFHGSHAETPLHWAASCDDVDLLDALLDHGADIDALGGVIGGGTALADARAFRQWRAADLLVRRGARVTMVDAATLGLLDILRTYLAATDVDADEVTVAFWGACHGGRLAAAQLLLDHGADPNRVADWEPLTPLGAARRSGAADVVAWLRDLGAT